MAQNVFTADLVVQHVEAEDRLRLRLAIELSLKAPDLIGRFKAHRQSTLSLTIFKSTPEVRALSSAGVTRLHRYYNPVRLPSGPSTYSMLKARPSTRTGLPRLPALPFQRAMPITPVNQQGAHVDCFPVCAAFPAIRSGRRSHRNFRGVLRLYSSYSPLDCSAAQSGLCYEASIRPIARPNRSSATRSIDNSLGGSFLHW